MLNSLKNSAIAATFLTMASAGYAEHHPPTEHTDDPQSQIYTAYDIADEKNKFVVRLHDGVNYSSSKSIVESLKKFAQADPDKEIVFYINSGGGSVTQAMAIYDTMQAIPNDITTICEGNAQSAAFFLLTAGTPGKRFALPNCIMMGHQSSAGENGTNESREIYLEYTTLENDRFLGIIADNSGWDRQTIIDMISHNMYLTAEEAAEMGFIDKVIAPVKPEATPGVKTIEDIPDWYCDGKRGEISRICAVLNHN